MPSHFAIDARLRTPAGHGSVGFMSKF
ncbi:hypothetical protein CCACVL1_07134 [Corchorus capsularis]|uniref:Uncharacterized protein n=1 Tax=Corchorus capsularis TaxID=210143 RepID=A0A1R3J9A1_COCAP|nr:hypothetical protein CCACVL1_07134 [Corchorus capsularis]